MINGMEMIHKMLNLSKAKRKRKKKFIQKRDRKYYNKVQ